MTGVRHRHHLHDSVVQKAVRRAAVRAGVAKHATAHAVLYSIKPDELGFRERFFVLTHAEMAQAQAVRNGHEALSYAERARRLAKGVDNVLARDVEAHGEAWLKIVTWCSSTT